MATGNANNKDITVHTGSEKGFLIGGLLMCKARVATRDYHNQMMAENFEKMDVTTSSSQLMIRLHCRNGYHPIPHEGGT